MLYIPDLTYLVEDAFVALESTGMSFFFSKLLFGRHCTRFSFLHSNAPIVFFPNSAGVDLGADLHNAHIRQHLLGESGAVWSISEPSGAVRSNLEQFAANIWDQAETIGSGTTKSHMPKKYNRLKLVLRQNKN